MHLATPEDRTRISSPAEVANLVMMDMGLLEQEELRVCCWTQRTTCSIFLLCLYKGSLNMAMVRVGEIFR